MAAFMLDTDMLIKLRQRRSPGVTARVAALLPGVVLMSVVTYGELWAGAEKSVDPARQIATLRAMCTIVPVADMPAEAGAAYGAIRADLERRGQIIGANDLWIAAHARTAGLTLVTGNEREFRRVPGLSIENWAAA